MTDTGDVLADPDDWGVVDPRWAGIRTEWIDVRGHPVRVLRADGRPDGRPQLLVHGLGGSATNWLEVISELAEFGPVAAPDLPGFGATRPPWPSAARVSANVAFVAALADTLGWDRLTLHGNSMGALIATLLAADRPDLVRRLVLAAPALPAPRRDAHRVPKMALLTFAPFLLPPLGQAVIRGRYARESAEELYARTIDLVYADPSRVREPLRLVGNHNAELGRQSPWRAEAFSHAAASVVAEVTRARRIQAAVDRVASPVLVVWGDDDRLIGRPVIDGAIHRRPDWDLEVIPDCGHTPMLEWPDRYLELVGGWLRERGVAGAVPAGA